MEDKEAIGRAFAAMEESYNEQIDVLRGQLQAEKWAREEAERELEDPRQERRRRVFEQVAIGYSLKDWSYLNAGIPCEEIVMGWSKNTAEYILSEADRFATKEQP